MTTRPLTHTPASSPGLLARAQANPWAALAATLLVVAALTRLLPATGSTR